MLFQKIRCLSHDLLEGCYLRCGLASDILLMDGYPSKYNSFMNRLSRWIRGDWQITKWISKKSPLNLISKYKILDNLRRSLLEISLLIAMIYTNLIGILYNKKIYPIILIISIIVVFPFLLELINMLIFKKEGEQKQKTFTPKISGLKGTFLRGIITLGCLPYKAYVSTKAIVKTIYRVTISHKNLLEWTTSEEAEKQAKSDIVSYYNQMAFNSLVGVVTIGIGFLKQNIFATILGIWWFFIPMVMWYISKEKMKKAPIELLDNKEQTVCFRYRKKNLEVF